MIISNDDQPKKYPNLVHKNDSLTHHRININKKTKNKKVKVKLEENFCMKILFFLKDCQLN